MQYKLGLPVIDKKNANFAFQNGFHFRIVPVFDANKDCKETDWPTVSHFFISKIKNEKGIFKSLIRLHDFR